jgi:hypothetical protein
MGIDLATHSPSRLVSWGIQSNVISRLAPFLGTSTSFGPRGAAAQTALTLNGVVVLDASTVEQLSRGGLNYTRGIVQTLYDRDKTTGVSFSELPMEAQTTIVDVAYPNGPNLNVSAPRFWGYVTRGEFGAAVTELNNWFGPNNSNQRYRNAAQLLQSGIANMSLPITAPGGRC